MEILSVIVLYKRTLEASQTIVGLIESFRCHPELLRSISVLIWDNSPEPLKGRHLPFPYIYENCPENIGVSGAYNKGMVWADKLECQWMMLLDQDTIVSPDFLGRMLEHGLRLKSESHIAAIAPVLIAEDRVASPVRVRFYGSRPLSRPKGGVHRRRIYAANSGLLVRLSALQKVGGYDKDFWLDHSDVVLFDKLHREGKRLYIAEDLRLQHLLAIHDYEGSMSLERYRNFVLAEGAYYDLYRSRLENSLQTLRLFVRGIKQSVCLKNREFSRMTWRYLKSRLSLNKSERLYRWRSQLNERHLPTASGATGLDER